MTKNLGLRAKEGEAVKNGNVVFFTELKRDFQSLDEMKEYVNKNGGQIVEICWKDEDRSWNNERNDYQPCAVVEDSDVYKEFDCANYLLSKIDDITDVFESSSEFNDYIEDKYPRLDQDDDDFNWDDDKTRDEADKVLKQAQGLEKQGTKVFISVENNREFNVLVKPNLCISHDNWHKEICVVNNGYVR